MKNGNQKPQRTILKIAIVGITIVILVLGTNWVTYARPPLQESVEALESDSEVIVTDLPWLTFAPTGKTKAGFIFYPGGRIDPEGYAVIMNTIASEGYFVIVPKMPLNMAAFNVNAAAEIIWQNTNITQWIIAGHSVGGTMAAQYAINHPQNIDGVMIWASYPAESDELKETSVPMITLYGSEDPTVNEQSLGERMDIYPDQAEFFRIDGGDHHQFGAYEIKPDEHHAIIPAEEQYEQIIQATLDFLDSVIEE